MAVNSITAGRVSHNLQTLRLLDQLRGASVRLFDLQQKLGSGRRILSPGDDPVGAGRAIRYAGILSRQDQILENIRAADSFISATDASVTDVGDLLIQAASIASEQVNSFHSADERAAAATVIDSIIAQLENVGNRQYQGRFLFGGRRVAAPPLDSSLGFVTFAGDPGDLRAFVGADAPLAYNLHVADLFNLRANVVPASADLDPILSTDARLADLDGALGRGIRLGAVRFTEKAGPDISFDVDFSGVTTVADLIARFNQAAADAGTTLSLSVAGNHFRLDSAGGFNVAIEDLGNGFAAADLGLLTADAPAPFDGADVRPRLRLTTPLADLYGGAGLSLLDGVSITNGDQAGVVTFTGAQTVQDVLNRLNASGLGLRAEINAAGTGIDIINLISGTELRIGENGGADATALGIRTFHAGTPLSALNDGRGVATVPGDDLLITDGDGLQFAIDLDGAATVADALARINAAAAAAGSTLTAGLALSGNGIRLAQPSGSAPIVVDRASLSPAIDGLGLAGVAGSPTEFVGADVNPVRAGGVFSALYDLRDALLANDTARITVAGQRLADAQNHVTSVQGRVGARAAAVRQRLTLTEDAVHATKSLLSEVVDLDYTEAVTKFQQVQTALQAGLQTGSLMLDLSLLDFLR